MSQLQMFGTRAPIRLTAAQNLRSLLSITGTSAAQLLHRPRAPQRVAAAPAAQVAATTERPGRSTSRGPLADGASGERRKGPRRNPAHPKAGPHRPRRPAAGPEVRLNKALAATAAVSSRRAADEAVFAGRVAVNGEVVLEPGMRIDPLKDKLSLDGKLVSEPAAGRKFYFALNKPKGYLCSAADRESGSGRRGLRNDINNNTKNNVGPDRRDPGAPPRRLALELLKPWLTSWRERTRGSGPPPRFFTVGRLDAASVGLIFVTNDGDWAQKVSHPSSGITKEYSVTLDRRPNRRELAIVSGGCEVDGRQVAPEVVALDEGDSGGVSRIRVVLSEGRNREVGAAGGIISFYIPMCFNFQLNTASIFLFYCIFFVIVVYMRPLFLNIMSTLQRRRYGRWSRTPPWKSGG
jgi:16S rRNA U516 pseudouridylate synthase RsuA-like enzyme